MAEEVTPLRGGEAGAGEWVDDGLTDNLDEVDPNPKQCSLHFSQGQQDVSKGIKAQGVSSKECTRRN